MITLPQLVYECAAQVEGGTFTTESKFSVDLIESLCNWSRSELIKESQTGINPRLRMKKINNNWIQKYTCEYDANIQPTESYNKNFRRFVCPPVIEMADWTDGFRYVGSPNELCSWPRLGSGTMKAVYAKHPRTNPNCIAGITWAYEVNQYGEGEIDVYNEPAIREVLVEGIFTTPAAVSTYRKDVDPYPISEDMVGLIKDMLLPILSRMASVPSDTIDDAQDSLNVSPVSQTLGRRK